MSLTIQCHWKCIQKLCCMVKRRVTRDRHLPVLIYLTKEQMKRMSNNRTSNSSIDSNQLSSKWSPHSSPDPLIEESVVTHFWRKAISATLWPFVLTGSPVLSIILSSKRTQKSVTDETLKWLRQLLSDPVLKGLNILSLSITVALNLWFIYLLYDLIGNLLIFGQLSKNFVHTTFELFETIPVVLVVDILWFKGYLLKHVLQQLNSTHWNPELKNQTPIVLKLVLVYVLCLSLHLINVFTFRWKLNYGFTSETSAQYFIHLPHRVVNTLLFPVYIVFCAVSDHYLTILEKIILLKIV